MTQAGRKYRIWAQGGTDRIGHANYLQKLLPYLQSVLDPDFSLDFQTITPSITTTHALAEFRFGRAAIRGAIAAQRQGYDAYFMNHFQDAGLAEARATVDMPVLGLGETTLLHACTLGRKLGLVAINPAFVPWHADQVTRYGLSQRVVGVRTIDARIKDYMDAFVDPDTRTRLHEIFLREARALLADGADVIVPTGGIPMMLFAAEPGAQVDGAPVVNGIAVVVKAVEMAIKLRRLCGLGASRRPASGYALPDEQTVTEFMDHG
jgi:Asp/Glu/hydantoin racemase